MRLQSIPSLGRFCLRSELPSFAFFEYLQLPLCHTPIDKACLAFEYIWSEVTPSYGYGNLWSDKTLWWTNLPTCWWETSTCSFSTSAMKAKVDSRQVYVVYVIKMAGNYQELSHSLVASNIWSTSAMVADLLSSGSQQASYIPTSNKHATNKQDAKKEVEISAYLLISSVSKLSQGTFRSFSTSTLNIHILLRWGLGCARVVRGSENSSISWNLNSSQTTKKHQRWPESPLSPIRPQQKLRRYGATVPVWFRGFDGGPWRAADETFGRLVRHGHLAETVTFSHPSKGIFTLTQPLLPWLCQCPRSTS